MKKVTFSDGSFILLQAYERNSNIYYKITACSGDGKAQNLYSRDTEYSTKDIDNLGGKVSTCTTKYPSGYTLRNDKLPTTIKRKALTRMSKDVFRSELAFHKDMLSYSKNTPVEVGRMVDGKFTIMDMAYDAPQHSSKFVCMCDVDMLNVLADLTVESTALKFYGSKEGSRDQVRLETEDQQEVAYYTYHNDTDYDYNLGKFVTTHTKKLNTIKVDKIHYYLSLTGTYSDGTRGTLDIKLKMEK